MNPEYQHSPTSVCVAYYILYILYCHIYHDYSDTFCPCRACSKFRIFQFKYILMSQQLMTEWQKGRPWAGAVFLISTYKTCFEHKYCTIRPQFCMRWIISRTCKIRSCLLVSLNVVQSAITRYIVSIASYKQFVMRHIIIQRCSKPETLMWRKAKHRHCITTSI